MHHERCDGSGYPSQLDSSLIDDFAMITAIADVYDAMTAARRYREMCIRDRNGNITDKIEGADHFLDALRYATEEYWNYSKMRILD